MHLPMSLIAAQRLLVEQVALLRLAAGVADHAGGAANQGDGAVAAELKMFENHHPDQVPDMQRVGRRVDAQVGRGHLFVELLFRAGHDGVDHAAPGEFFDKILPFHIRSVLVFVYSASRSSALRNSAS